MHFNAYINAAVILIQSDHVGTTDVNQFRPITLVQL